MAHALRYLMLGIVCGLAGLTGLRAQPGASLLRFTVFAAKLPDGLAFVPKAGAPAQKLVFTSTSRSAVYEYRGPAPLRFVDATGAVVAEAAVPAEIREALLLFLPANEKNVRYRIAVLDDAPSARAPGSLAVLNLSGLALAGTVGAEPVNLQAGLNPSVAVGTNTTKVALLSTQQGRTYPAYTGTVKLGRGERALLLLFPPVYQGSGEVSFRLLIDNPGAAKSAAPVRK